ncbi:MAG: hypothetical protein AAGG02_19055 [Cyanobacteria bacterium P01_H01_bin.15]
MERLVIHDIGVVPEAAISGAALVQTESSAYLTFNAMRDTDRPSPYGGFYREDAGTAIIELVGCSITKFGYPNDEAWSAIPRYSETDAHGVYEVENSDWLIELAELNRHGFPETKEWPGHHFVFLFHDSSFECICRELKVEVSQEKFLYIWQRLTSRVLEG